MSSIFVDRAGEWKLFGLEYLTPSKDPPPVKILPSLRIYNPPEYESSKHEDNPPWLDSFCITSVNYNLFFNICYFL